MSLSDFNMKPLMVRYINLSTICCNAVPLLDLTGINRKRYHIRARIYIRSTCLILPEGESGTDSKGQNLNIVTL